MNTLLKSLSINFLKPPSYITLDLRKSFLIDVLTISCNSQKFLLFSN